MNVAIVYWSGTGNTEAMAMAIANSVKKNGAEADLIQCSSFDASKMDAYDAIAFGCPAMGAEELEDSEFLPMFEGCKAKLNGKKIALFGSYGWGDGEWMRNWEDECRSLGANLVAEGLICNEAPDDAGIANCEELGLKLA